MCLARVSRVCDRVCRARVFVRIRPRPLGHLFDRQGRRGMCVARVCLARVSRACVSRVCLACVTVCVARVRRMSPQLEYWPQLLAPVTGLRMYCLICNVLPRMYCLICNVLPNVECTNWPQLLALEVLPNLERYCLIWNVGYILSRSNPAHVFRLLAPITGPSYWR